MINRIHKLTKILFSKNLDEELVKLHRSASSSYRLRNATPPKAPITRPQPGNRNVYVCHPASYNSPHALDSLFHFIQEERIVNSPQGWIFGVPHEYGTPEIDFLNKVGDMTGIPVIPSVYPVYGEEVETEAKKSPEIPQDRFHLFLLGILTAEGLPKMSVTALMSDKLGISPEKIKESVETFRESITDQYLISGFMYGIPGTSRSSITVASPSRSLRSQLGVILAAYNTVNSRYWGEMLRKFPNNTLLLYMVNDYFSQFRRVLRPSHK